MRTVGLTDRQWLWADSQGLPLGSQGMCGLHPPWRLYQVLAQHAGPGPACLLTRLLPAFSGTSAMSQVLPLQRQEGPGEGSVLSEHQM